MTAFKAGDVVTLRPWGQKRRQTVEIVSIDGEFVSGLLVSKKYPGDYRGYAAGPMESVEAVE